MDIDDNEDKKSLNLALDFDDTYSADPVFWSEFIKLAHKFGHQVYLVTMRHDHGREKDEVEAEINGRVPVIYCSRHWKKKTMEKHGIVIDIWCDDMPEAIGDQRGMNIFEYSTGQILPIWDWLDKK